MDGWIKHAEIQSIESVAVDFDRSMIVGAEACLCVSKIANVSDAPNYLLMHYTVILAI